MNFDRPEGLFLLEEGEHQHQRDAPSHSCDLFKASVSFPLCSLNLTTN